MATNENKWLVEGNLDGTYTITTSGVTSPPVHFNDPPSVPTYHCLLCDVLTERVVCDSCRAVFMQARHMMLREMLAEMIHE